MASIELMITTTETVLPAGRTFAGYRFTLTAPSGNSAQQTTTETKVVFSDAAPGTYTAMVEALDTEGVVIGGVTTISVVVPESQVAMYMAPTGMSYNIVP
jgi:hypothetical protein